jgi:hypothetical protein
LQKGEHGFACQRAKDAVKVKRRNPGKASQRPGRPLATGVADDRFNDFVDSFAVLRLEQGDRIAICASPGMANLATCQEGLSGAEKAEHCQWQDQQ